MAFQPFDVSKFRNNFSAIGDLPHTQRQAQAEQMNLANQPEAILLANALKEAQAKQAQAQAKHLDVLGDIEAGRLDLDRQIKPDEIKRKKAETDLALQRLAFEKDTYSDKRKKLNADIDKIQMETDPDKKANYIEKLVGRLNKLNNEQGSEPSGLAKQIIKKEMGVAEQTADEKMQTEIKKATALERNKLDTVEMSNIEKDVPIFNETMLAIKDAEVLMQDPEVKKAFGLGQMAIERLMDNEKYGALKPIFGNLLARQASKMSSRALASVFNFADKAKPSFKDQWKTAWGKLQQSKKMLSNGHNEGQKRYNNLQRRMYGKKALKSRGGRLKYDPSTGGFSNADS
jgi:hypothetical protein